MSTDKEHRVLILNTGGTIAMVHEDDNPLNPLKPGNWGEITQSYPVLNTLESLHIKTKIYTFEPLLDSSDIYDENWKKMAQVISENYDSYDGFMILHGTDTMCYTASALSFMLEHLSKPVILTGSQLPLAVPRSDAMENFVTALSIAAGIDVNDGTSLPTVPEVCVFFRGKLLRGNRSRKLSSNAYSGFESPNYPPLGVVGEHISINTQLIKKADGEEFFANTELVTDVMALDIFPSLNPDIIKRIAAESDSNGEKIRALILKTYGAGNAPSNSRFMSAIEYLMEKEVLVVDVTQCPQGMVEIGLYESSALLLDKGVISGLDLTPESALCKLMWLFGMGWDVDQVKKQMQLDQRGEQSLNIFNIDYGPGSADPVFNGQQLIPGEIEFDRLESAILQIQGASFKEPHSGTMLNLHVYANYQNLEASTGTDIIQYAGACRKKIDSGVQKTSLFLDITGSVKKFFTKGRPGRIGLVADDSKYIQWEKLNLALYVRV